MRASPAAIAPGVIVHGGAGALSADRHDAVIAACRRAVAAGLHVLGGRGSALDAAQAACRVLEDEPELNAAVGCVLTRAETAEMDAAIMCGRTLAIGGIAAVENLRQPIDLARAVLEDGEHVLLAGSHAWEFARELGIAPCDPAELITKRSRDRVRDEARRRSATADPGTVGACAIDADGHVAAATSTGGMTFKRPGRVGDTPLAGCGTYADDGAGAASATGHGEAIIRVGMTRSCIERLRAGASASAGAWASVAELHERVGGRGGIICVDASGRFGAGHNTESMAFGVGRVDSAVHAGVELFGGEDLMQWLR